MRIGSSALMMEAVTGSVYLVPVVKKMYARPTCTAPSTKTARSTGAVNTLSRRTSGDRKIPQASCPKKTDDSASPFSKLFSMKTPA